MPRSSGRAAARGRARRARAPLRRAAATRATRTRRTLPRTPPPRERGRSVRGTATRRGSTWRGAEGGRKPRGRARRRPLLGRAAGTRGPRRCPHPPPVSGSCGFATAVATVAGAPSRRPSAHLSSQRSRVAQPRKSRPAATTTTTTTLPHRSKVSSLSRPLRRCCAFFQCFREGCGWRRGTQRTFRAPPNSPVSSK